MEKTRLKEARENKSQWKKWGPYLSDRQWGTVRKDYSENGDAWNFSPTIMPARAPTGGVRMVLLGSPMTSSGSVLRWPFGLARILFSKSDSSD